MKKPYEAPRVALRGSVQSLTRGPGSDGVVDLIFTNFRDLGDPWDTPTGGGSPR